MELLQLRYFFESAKNASFSKTARTFLVPTSAVSSSIRRLEQELGCKLFDRSCNRIMLNNNGRQLQQALGIALFEIDRAVDTLSAAHTDSREIKMLVRAMRSKVTDYIIEYKAKHPHIVFKTVFDFSETNFENYDIIIDEKTDKYSEYESFELCCMRLRMQVAKDSPLCNKKLSLKQLVNQPFISMDEQNNMHKLLIKACSRAGFRPNIVVQSNDIKCYEKWIAAGMGIGIAREHHAQNLEKTAFLNVTDFDEHYTVYAYYKKQENYGNMKHFVDFLKLKSE